MTKSYIFEMPSLYAEFCYEGLIYDENRNIKNVALYVGCIAT